MKANPHNPTGRLICADCGLEWDVAMSPAYCPKCDCRIVAAPVRDPDAVLGAAIRRLVARLGTPIVIGIDRGGAYGLHALDEFPTRAPAFLAPTLDAVATRADAFFAGGGDE
jgi:hypothetical protein